MRSTGLVSVDHHQFLFGVDGVDFTDPHAHGTLLEAGTGFVSFNCGISFGPATVTLALLDESTTNGDLSEWEVVEETDITATTAMTVTATDGTPAEGLPPIPAGTYRIRAAERGRDLHYGDEVDHATEEYLIELRPTTAAKPQPRVRTLRKTDKAWSQASQVNETDIRTDRVYIRDASGAVITVAPQSPEAQAVRAELNTFGGKPLTPALAEVFSSREVAGLDRDLIDKVEAASPEQQIVFAHWCIRQAWEHAGFADVDWFAAVLDNMDAGQPAHKDFIYSYNARIRLDDDPRITRTIVSGLPASQESVQQYAALHAYSQGMEPGISPLAAAIEAFRYAAITYGMDYLRLTEAAHRDFFR